MSKGVYPGSFDPVTLGHLDIIERAAKLVDELVVAVIENPNKKCLLTVEERQEHLRRVTAHLPNVTVGSFYGLTVDYANKIGANMTIRGLRTVSDFQLEFQLANINRSLDDGVETIFIPASPAHESLSSTGVKEVLAFSDNMGFMVPEQVKDEVVAAYRQRRCRT